MKYFNRQNRKCDINLDFILDQKIEWHWSERTTQNLLISVNSRKVSTWCYGVKTDHAQSDRRRRSSDITASVLNEREKKREKVNRVNKVILMTRLLSVFNLQGIIYPILMWVCSVLTLYWQVTAVSFNIYFMSQDQRLYKLPLRYNSLYS